MDDFFQAAQNSFLRRGPGDDLCVNTFPYKCIFILETVDSEMLIPNVIHRCVSVHSFFLHEGPQMADVKYSIKVYNDVLINTLIHVELVYICAM